MTLVNAPTGAGWYSIKSASASTPLASPLMEPSALTFHHDLTRSLLALGLCSLAAMPAQAQNFQLGGTWVCNQGRVRLIPPVTPGNRSITIEQSGARLTLVDDTGQSSLGQLTDVDEITAPGWSYGERGFVGINVDGTFHRYKDASQRFKLPADSPWNFIRWDGGHLCVRT